MKISQFVLLLTLVLTLIITSTVPSLSVGVKYKTAGIYVDSSGGQHAWKVNEAHTLLWDNEPYIPVGGAFVSRYLALGATEDNYASDVKALDTIKSKGITDIILKSTGPITSVDPAALQKMIDYLDANGFTYGIEMNDGPKEALRGYLISPNRYRLEGPTTDTSVTCDWPDVDSALYVIVEKMDNVVKAVGGAVVKDGKVTINLIEPLTSGQILIVYPHKSYKSVADGGMGDIWTGFSEYRDRVIAFFKNIKFGPGMRFFLEPFTSKMDFTGEMASFLPDSSGFRLGFEAYLTKRHFHEGALRASWGFIDDLDTIELAARLVPLWGGGRGVPYAYDRASAQMFQVDSGSQGFWRDAIDYRDSSAQAQMNNIANVLRKQVTDVPVVFKASKYHRVYANPFGMGGYDGLGAEAYGTGDAPIAKVAGPVYSLADESAKTTWFIVSATQTTSGKKTLVGYANEITMAVTLDFFREVGCKGFFIDSLQALPDDSRGNFSLLNDVQQLDWLNNFKNKIKSASLVDFKPDVVSYPVTPVTGAGVKRLMPNTWWLPSLKMGQTSYVGDGLAAYKILSEDLAYLWSTAGEKTITLKISGSTYPSIAFPIGKSIVKKKDGMFSITLTDTPTVLRGMDLSLVFPYESAETEIARLATMIPEVDKAGYDVSKARQGLESAQRVIKNGKPLTAYGMAQTSIQELLEGLGADVWLEGEQSVAHNFDGAYPLPGASSALVMLLDTNENPPLMPYSASYVFNVQSNSSYEIWIAGTPPSDSSPVSYTVDDVNWMPLAVADGKVENYAQGLSWYKIGATNLIPGRQNLRLRVDGKRAGDDKYYFAIDAIVFSPRGFTPNGVIKPY